ncbi:MAG: NAD-dependent protein deacylase [Defluviitaleaceae bacterium]|nr:NAD-dependent protein deacylase [Defluviitaleaceae bacterium]
MQTFEESVVRLRGVLEGAGSLVFFGGAGVSTESGVPDFRSDEGLHSANKVYGYPPEQLLSRTFFDTQPELFYQYYKERLLHPHAVPNMAHKALAVLEQRGRAVTVITQNVDGLHQAAGSRNVLELHGTAREYTCVGCAAPYDAGYIRDPENCRIFVPICGKCGETVRPNIVLYEEALDEGVMAASAKAISAADCLIVGGTSLAVYPAAGLLRYFGGRELVLINKTGTPYDNSASLIIRENIAEIMGVALNIKETR